MKCCRVRKTSRAQLPVTALQTSVSAPERKQKRGYFLSHQLQKILKQILYFIKDVKR